MNTTPANEQAVSTFHKANKHASRAATAARAGNNQEAWEQRSYARFYRTAAIGLLAEANPDGYARMIVKRALSGSRR